MLSGGGKEGDEGVGPGLGVVDSDWLGVEAEEGDWSEGTVSLLEASLFSSEVELDLLESMPCVICRIETDRTA